jgi:hypothetical protein
MNEPQIFKDDQISDEKPKIQTNQKHLKEPQIMNEPQNLKEHQILKRTQFFKSMPNFKNETKFLMKCKL